ncbi:MAG: hypothetical protein Roseis2KO_26810 [Roseivirga sp.]
MPYLKARDEARYTDVTSVMSLRDLMLSYWIIRPTTLSSQTIRKNSYLFTGSETLRQMEDMKATRTVMYLPGFVGQNGK